MKTICIKIVFAFLMIGSWHITIAQLDNTFSSDGKLLINTSANAEIYNVKRQSDGKSVLAGKSGDSILVVRLNTDGSLDNSFGANGVTHINLPSLVECAYALAVQPDNKIIIACNYFTGTTTEMAILRLSTSGMLDTGFDSDGILVINGLSSPTHIAIQGDGKIIVNTYMGILRLNDDGNFDSTFSVDGKFEFNNSVYTINDLILQPDEKILLAGAYNNNSIIIRINTDGTFDTGFGTSGIKTVDVYNDSDDWASAVIVLEDGDILVGGHITNENYLMRLNVPNGSIDISYDTDGIMSYSFPGASNTLSYDIAEDMTSNDVLVTGTALYGTKGNLALSRVSSAGVVEAYASLDISNGTSAAKSMYIQPDRKIVLGGYAIDNNQYEFAATRFLPDFSTLIENVKGSELTTGFNLFPNPASQSINVHSSYHIKQIKVLDVIGNEVLNHSSDGNTQVDISSLPKGLYNFVITTDQGIGSKKVSVQ